MAFPVPNPNPIKWIQLAYGLSVVWFCFIDSMYPFCILLNKACEVTLSTFSVETSGLIIIFVFLCTLTVLFTLLRSDPYIPLPSKTKVSHNSINTLQSCKYCRLEDVLSYGDKHCFQVGRCVYGYDHYCWWLNIAIGKKNYNIFVVYLVFQLFLILLALLMVLSTLNKDLEYNFTMVIRLILVSFYSDITLPITFLLLLHAYLIITNKKSHQLFQNK